MNNKLAASLIRRSKEQPFLSPLQGKPTIFDKEWVPFIKANPCKINLLTINKDLKNFTLDLVQKAQMEQITQEFNSRTTNLTHKEAQPDYLLMTLASNSKQSIASKTYIALARKDTETKSDFSTTTKWEKQGLNYSRATIEAAAATIRKLKIPGITRACLYKHNLCGYIQPKVLSKLKFRKNSNCNSCQEPTATYTHLFFDCPLSIYLKEQLQLQTRMVYKLPSTPIISINNIMMLTKDGALVNPKISDTMLTLIAIMKHQIHKNYHLETDFQDPKDESRAIKLYNEILSISHIKNPKLRAFKKIKGRLRDPERKSGYSESLLSIHLRLFPNTQPSSTGDPPPQEQTDSPEDMDFVAGLLEVSKDLGLTLSTNQQAFLRLNETRALHPL